jgi:hypothetical protein
LPIYDAQINSNLNLEDRYADTRIKLKQNLDFLL